MLFDGKNRSKEEAEAVDSPSRQNFAYETTGLTKAVELTQR